MLLCTWISNCPIAVTHFLHNQENVPFVSLKRLATRHKFHCLYFFFWSLLPYLLKNGCVSVKQVVVEFLLDSVTPAADSSDLRELGRGWAAGAGPVCAASRHLHLLQRQLAGKLHQVSVNSRTLKITQIYDVMIDHILHELKSVFLPQTWTIIGCVWMYSCYVINCMFGKLSLLPDFVIQMWIIQVDCCSSRKLTYFDYSFLGMTDS